MARKGRSRKAGRRERNGRIQRQPLVTRADQEKQTVLTQPHRRAFPEDKRRSQNLEDELGRMFEAGMLRTTDPEDAIVLLDAGRKYQRLMAAFHRTMVTPMTTASAGFAYVAEKVETDPDHDPLAHLAATEKPEDRHQRILWDVDRVTRFFAVLPPSEARFERGALDAVCLHDQRILPETRIHLVKALYRLAWLWALFPQKVERTYAYRGERPEWDESTDKIVVHR